MGTRKVVCMVCLDHNLLTDEEPSPKRLVYKQLFDTFKSILSLIFNLLLSVARGHLEYIIFLSG